MTGARLERQGGGGDEAATWSWHDNPFVGTREFNGLRVMMALLNNWDLKDVNNRVFDTIAGGEQYGITDLGATFGRTGNIITRSKGVSKDYAETKFIARVTATHVDFVMQSRPFLPLVVHLPNYRSRTRMEGIVKRVPSPTRAGSEIASDGCPPIRSATPSAPAASRPTRSRCTPQVVVGRIRSTEGPVSPAVRPFLDAGLRQGSLSRTALHR